MGDVEQKLVVEGYIENHRKPYVILTKTSGYFEDIPSSYEELLDYIVSDADVEVCNGSVCEKMELKYDPSVAFFPFYEAPTIMGKEGETYTLKITDGGKTYSSSTTIPTLIPLESVWFELGENSDSLGFCWAHLTDPDTLGNCYRLMTKRINKDKWFVIGNRIVHADKFINGLSYDFYFGKGINPYGQIDNYDGDYFLNTDTVVVKFCSIDSKSFSFWQSMESVLYSSNPFKQPGSAKSNIEGGALGIWCGYTASYDTVYCSKK